MVLESVREGFFGPLAGVDWVVVGDDLGHPVPDIVS